MLGGIGVKIASYHRTWHYISSFGQYDTHTFASKVLDFNSLVVFFLPWVMVSPDHHRPVVVGETAPIIKMQLEKKKKNEDKWGNGSNQP